MYLSSTHYTTKNEKENMAFQFQKLFILLFTKIFLFIHDFLALSWFYYCCFNVNETPLLNEKYQWMKKYKIKRKPDQKSPEEQD